MLREKGSEKNLVKATKEDLVTLASQLEVELKGVVKSCEYVSTGINQEVRVEDMILALGGITIKMDKLASQLTKRYTTDYSGYLCPL